MMGDGTNEVRASNVLNDYSVIYYNNHNFYICPDCEENTLFRCVSGIKLYDIRNLYFNDIPLANDECNGFIIARTADVKEQPGILNVWLCGTLNTKTEGVYTCTLRNSSMMNQSMSVGIYLSGRSKSSRNGFIR